MDTRFHAPVTNFHDLLLDAVCMVDTSGSFVYVSAAFETIFGYTPTEIIGRKMIDLVVPADRARTLAEAQNIMNGQGRVGFENRYIRKDGKIVNIMWSARWSEADQVRVAVARDITEKKQAEAKQAALFAIAEAAHATDDLPELYKRIHKIIENLLSATGFAVALQDDVSKELQFVYHADSNGELLHSRFAKVLCQEALLREQPIRLTSGQPLKSLTPSQEDCPASEHWLCTPLCTPMANIGALVLHSTDTGNEYSSEDQDLLHFVSAQIATTIQRKQMYASLHFMAVHDELTGLPNRRLFQDRLEGALSRSQRQQKMLSLLFIDLNKFKQVNDQYGHVAGDLLLQEIAKRVKCCVRESDTVARIGGDEFIVVLENVEQPEHAILVRDKINLEIIQPIILPDGRTLSITASIGIAHYPEHGADMQKLLRHADQTMYLCKHEVAIVAAQ